MKNTAQSSRSRPSGQRVRIHITSLAMIGLLWVCLGGCNKTDSRAPDAELTKIASSLPTTPWQVSDGSLCKALPSGPDGTLTIQEIVEDRSLTLALRYSHSKAQGEPERYSLNAVHILTQPDQIGWHARLEEEIETWEGLINVSTGPEKISSVSVGGASTHQKKDSSELRIFQDAIAMALGCLNTLEQSCASSLNSEAGAQFKINLPNSKSVSLHMDSPRSGRAQVGETSFSISTTEKGIQWLGTSPNSSSGKVVIFRLPAIPPSS